MKYLLSYTANAVKNLHSLDKTVADRVMYKLDFFVSQNNPLIYAQKLTGLNAKYRFRVGDYRVIFKTDNQGLIVILVILTIKHRREAYRI